jgi:hypothetical protein
MRRLVCVKQTFPLGVSDCPLSKLGRATRLAALATTHRLPVMAPYREFAEAGGLVA